MRIAALDHLIGEAAFGFRARASSAKTSNDTPL
jgi:hypothetical protein